METPLKHYKFVNSKTGNIIYHYSVSANLDPDQVKKELKTIQAEVASNNGMFLETVYWEEIKDEE